MASPRVDLSPPASLPEAAYPVWTAAIAALADAGALSPELLPAVERLALLTARWREAEARVRTEGVIVEAPISHVPAANVWLSVARAAEAQRIECELGLMPVRRSRAGRAARPLLATGRPAPPSVLDRMFAEAELERP
jgi:phage terminase small subunit